MKNQDINKDIAEITAITRSVFSYFFVLQYLHNTIYDMEGELITSNSFLRTSIISHFRLTVLELTKIFPSNKDNSCFALGKFIGKLKMRNDLFKEQDINTLKDEIDRTYKKETTIELKSLIGDANTKLENEKTIVGRIINQRDKSIAHTDRTRIILPVSIADLEYLCRQAEIILDSIHLKVYNAGVEIGNVFEQRDELKNLIDEIVAGRKRLNLEAFLESKRR